LTTLAPPLERGGGPLERRAVAAGSLELRSAPGSPGRIVGTAIVYETRTMIGDDAGGFYELIGRGAATRALARETGLLLLWGHDRNEPLARRGRNLTVWEDDRGVHFEATLPDTSRGRDVAELVRAGIVSGCSFAFSIERDTWTPGAAGPPTRRVDEIGQLPELTITSMPAYPSTTVSAEARSRAEQLRSRPVTTSTTPARTSPRSARPAAPAAPASPYARGGFFADLAAVAFARHQQDTLIKNGVARDPGPGFGTIVARQVIDPVDAARRLARHHETRRGHLRDVGSAQFTGIVPAFGLPDAAEDAIGTGARARMQLAARLRPIPLPALGMAIRVSRFTTQAIAVPQTGENAAVTETDVATTAVDVNVALIAGYVDVSRQTIERGEFADVPLARELGAALGAAIEAQVIRGSNTNGETLGLLNTSGVTTVTYTDATPTPTEFFSKLHDAWQQVATANGEPPDAVVLHPRRAAWVRNGLDTASQPVRFPYEGSVIETAGMPTNLGAGTNEDAALIVNLREVGVAIGQNTVSAHVQPLAGQLGIRYIASAYVCVYGPAAVKAIGKVTGTGLAAPTF
jgi:HK97 family phage prohead protease